MAVVYLTRDHLLDAARRALAGYGEELERAGGGGWDFLVACSAMWERVSLAIGRFEEQSFPSTAVGPARATVTLAFSRVNFAAGAFKVKTGTLVRASSSGAVFITLADVEFHSVQLGPFNCPALAIGYGEEWNVDGQYTAPDGAILPGEIDTIDLPLLDPPFSERSLRVTNVDPAAGGLIGFLDIHGDDVDVHRVTGEGDNNYRGRVLAAAEAVSPTSVRAQVQRFLEGIGYTDDDWYLVETWDPRFSGCYDAVDVSFPLRPDYSLTRFMYDDPRPHARIQNRWLDMPNAEAAGILEIKDLTSVYSYAGAYDDPATTQADLLTALGSRASSTFDTPHNLATARPSCYDGIDRARELILKRLADLLSSIAAHGVVITVIAQGD